MVDPINPLESVTLYNGAINFMELSFENRKQDKLKLSFKILELIYVYVKKISNLFHADFMLNLIF